jgi:muconolactone delta-isomerase
LVFLKIRVDKEGLSADELWEDWEKEAEAVLAAKEAGTVVSMHKVVGQRRVVGIVDVGSHDELDRILMGGLPIAHRLEVEEVLPVREYEGFAEDVRNRWQATA